MNLDKTHSSSQRFRDNRIDFEAREGLIRVDAHDLIEKESIQIVKLRHIL